MSLEEGLSRNCHSQDKAQQIFEDYRKNSNGKNRNAKNKLQ